MGKSEGKYWSLGFNQKLLKQQIILTLLEITSDSG
jgi:hypothetical protein